MSEHRRSPRYKVCQMVRLDYGREERLEASTMNYSEHGLLCKTHVDLPIGTRVAVMLAMEEGDLVVPIPVEAKVVRKEPSSEGQWEIGFELLDLASVGHEKMMSYFERLSQGCSETSK